MKRILTIFAVTSFFLANAQTPASGPLRQAKTYEPVSLKPLKTNPLNKKDVGTGWFDWYQSLENSAANITGFRSTLFPDSNMKVTYAATGGGIELGNVGDHSIGMICDPRSFYFNGTPFQTTKFNPYTVDSVGMVYMYSRWNPDTSIHDTLVFQVYPASVMAYYTATALFTLPYNYQKNEGSSSTFKYYRVLTVADTISTGFGFLSIPVGVNVNWNNNGNNRFGVTVSYIPGRKDYATSEPFDTLDAGDWNPVNRFNQFEYQILQDNDITIESSVSDPVGMRIANNGLGVNTDIRYNMAGGNNGYYYGATWVNNSTQTQFLRFPRILWHGTSNNLAVKDITKDGYGLGNAYPNPVSGSTFTVDFQLPKAEKVTMALYDVTGKKVKDITASSYNAGTNSIEVNVDGLQPGVYVYTINAGAFVASKKITIID